MKKILFVLVVTLCLTSAGGYYFYNSYKGHKEAREKQIVLNRKKAAWDRLRVNLGREVARFRGEAGIVVKDLDTGWEIDFNKDMLIPSASLVKIPIMVSYYYASNEGKVNLAENVELSRQEKTGGSGQLKNVASGAVFSVQDLLKLMITHSDNTAANMLIDLFGIDTLNGYFAKLGLKHTNLSRRMMDFEDRRNGIENYTTADDMAYLLEGIYYKQFLGSDASAKCLGLLASQKINDRLPKKLPANIPVAHKTGLEYGVCHDVGIVFTDKGNFLICVLTKHNNRFAQPAKRFISRIALTTYNYYGNL